MLTVVIHYLSTINKWLQQITHQSYIADRFLIDRFIDINRFYRDQPLAFFLIIKYLGWFLFVLFCFIFPMALLFRQLCITESQSSVMFSIWTLYFLKWNLFSNLKLVTERKQQKQLLQAKTDFLTLLSRTRIQMMYQNHMQSPADAVTSFKNKMLPKPLTFVYAENVKYIFEYLEKITALLLFF